MIKKVRYFLSNSLTNNDHLVDYFKPLIQLIHSSWSRGKYLAKVKEIRKENSNTYTLVLEPSKRWSGFLAGQYIQISIEMNGSLMTRTFSLSSSPELFKQKGWIEISIQKQKYGKVTPLLEDILVKDQFLSISKANGEFTNKKRSNSFLFIAAGSGITPIKSLIDDLKGCENNNISLIYYASNQKHLFRDYLQSLEKQFQNLTITFINTAHESRVNLVQIEHACPDFKNREIYICGPSAMIVRTQTILNDENINTENVHYEYFGTAPINDLKIERNHQVIFKQSNIKISTNNTKHNTLLEMAESSGLNPNTGCRMGVCHQCICMKKQGVIYNTLTQSFSDTGSQEIQLCISVAASDVVLDL